MKIIATTRGELAAIVLLQVETEDKRLDKITETHKDWERMLACAKQLRQSVKQIGKLSLSSVEQYRADDVVHQVFTFPRW